MSQPDYAFIEPYDYKVDPIVFDKHHSRDYLKFKYVPNLMKRLNGLRELPVSGRKSFWNEVAHLHSRPSININVRNYDKFEIQVKVKFLIDTGAYVSILTAETADELEIDRGIGGGDPVVFKGIGREEFVGLPQWINVVIAGKLHPIPVLVPPNNIKIGKLKAAPLRRNILGRAAVTSCFLMCVDNKRLYAFPRRNSEPGMR